jgi:hypothetical protein
MARKRCAAARPQMTLRLDVATVRGEQATMDLTEDA